MRHVYEGWANGGVLWSVLIDRDGRRRKRPERRVEGYTMLSPFNGRRVRVTVEDVDEREGAEASDGTEA